MKSMNLELLYQDYKEVVNMKKVNSEKGMTLLVVLLTITVFMVIGLAVIGASINNMKQVTKVGSDIETTDIAEMGVQYYQSLIINFLNDQFSSQDNQKQIMNQVFNGSNDKNALINSYKDKFTTELINAFKSDPLLFTTSTDHFLSQKTIDKNSYFKIKIDPNGITQTPCQNGTSNNQCFMINFASNGYNGKTLVKQLNATYSFSYTINAANFDIVQGAPASTPIYQSLITQVATKKLRKCTPGEFSGNYFTANCSFDFLPQTNPNGIRNSFLVFNNGLLLEHLPHAISYSTLIIYSPNGSSITLGKFNPNGFINSDIVVSGNAILNDKIMKPSKSSIYINGNADLTNFELKNPDSASKVCITGEITPASMRTAEGVYSLKYNQTIYNQKCQETTNSVGNYSVTYKGQILGKSMSDKSLVTY